MSSLTGKVLPKSVKKYIRKQLEAGRSANEKMIPKYELEEKHITNLKAIKDRERLLKFFPVNAVVAEIGVFKGDFSETILKITSPKKLHLIDVWNTERYNSGLKDRVDQRFREEIGNAQVEINVGLSIDMVNHFRDEYFDWIYIDTDHSYATTKAELELYAPKMKPEGIISGHDFRMGNWTKGYRYGVIEAVYEFCVKHNWEIIYITMENKSSPSFAIRRLME